MTPADEIRATLDLLRDRGWHQGDPVGADGSVCLVTAHSIATDGLVGLDAIRALDGAVGNLFPGRGCGTRFNDHPDTTWEDVELVVKHAIGDLELGVV